MKIPKNHVLPTKTAQKIAVFANKQKKPPYMSPSHYHLCMKILKKANKLVEIYFISTLGHDNVCPCY